MHALDALDHKILRLLRKDGRMSNAKLAAEVGLSPSACLRRLRMLEQSGVIRGYTAIIDEHVREEMAVVIVQITLERLTDSYLRKFEAAIRKCPEIRECYLMTGEADYQLRVLVPSLEAFEEFLRHRLTRIDGVAQVTSSFALRPVTYKTRLPRPMKKG